MGDFGGDSGVEERIFVSLRVRPFISQEIEKNDHSKWEIINNTTIVFKNSLQDRSVMLPYANTFDRVFGHNSDTRQVYEEGAKGVALSVLNGINSSIFAYGQTSSGKTYTMNGITKYTVEDIYDYIQQHEEREFILKFSAMEIYNEGVSDLLSSDSTPLRLLDDPERGTVVEKLIEVRLRDKSHLEELLAICEDQRQIGETSLNEASSRSHQIIRLTIESSARYFHDRDNSSSLAATVSFVDLAGSERASQTLSAGTKFKEGSHINRSLLTLGTVIRKLSKGRNAHVPYRDSKLTRILQNSLGGNARTAIICTMNLARIHDEQSRNTLLFASCAKEVTTRARVNLVMSDKALAKHLQREVARLQDELNYAGSAYRTYELKEKDAQIMKMEKEIRELIQQRDLAESRLQDLLSSLGDDQVSRQSVESSQISVQSASKNQAFRQWGESIQPSVAYQPVASEDDSSISEASSICYQSTHQARMIIRSQSRSSEDQCKEVRCIEINDSKKRTNESSLLLDEICDSRLPITSEAKLKAYFEPRLEEDNGSLEWQNQVRMKQISDISTPRCLEKGRHENASTGSSSVSFGPEAEVLSGASQKLEEVPQPEDQKQLVHNQEIPQNPNENYKVEGIRREASTQTLLSCSESPSQQSSEFKKQKREIIELWDTCNVSLIRRTYFFLLFKGEPTDSIYMEVEHRRLSFLKRMLSQGKETETATFSVKNLRRERAMLHRRIQRKLSTEERNHLYIKWGIKLHSKKRAMQLAKLLWTDTKNIECVEESALLVAKLIGILKPDLVLKEMFGLSFMPREWHQSSCAWKSMLYFR